MRELRSIKELEKYLLEQIELAMTCSNGLNDYLIKQTKNMVNELVYQSYKPKEYKRTYELRESIECIDMSRNNKSVYAQIGHNTNLIHANTPNQHYSLDPNAKGDVSDFIPDIVINNLSGFFKGIGNDGKYHDIGYGFWRVKKPYFEKTVEEQDRSKDYLDILVRALKSNGNDVRII